MWQSDVHNRAKYGTVFSLNATVVPIHDGAKLLRFISIDADITDKIHTEEALKQAIKNKMMLEREMHRAVEEQHFHLVYQSQINMASIK